MINPDALWNWVHWLCQLVVNGDYGNVYLQLLPTEAQETMYHAGEFLAAWMGK
jgi:hypothetical protein